MVLAISGATGFIGKALVEKFREMKWTVRIMDRDSFSMQDEEFRKQKIEGSDVIINLSGAPVSAKWTPEYKLEILNSRVNTTRKIAENIILSEQKPGVFISTSAIGIYDSVHTHTEDSVRFSDSFLAKICRDWEDTARIAESVTRLVIFRNGLVLGEGGGALEKMYFPFSIGLGGKIGKGDQAFSFIHLKDLINMFFYVIENPAITGIVNAVSPYPTTNSDFTEVFGKVLRQPAWLTIPAFVLKMKFGEGAEVLLDGQSVLPEKLEKAGFRFQYPTLQSALIRIYGR